MVENLSDEELQRRVGVTGDRIRKLIESLDQVILGKPDVTRGLVAGVLAGGHVLLEGLPGLGKTEMVKGLARLCSIEFRRVQFTPDLLPSDITGSYILQEGEPDDKGHRHRDFVFQKGPVFCNILLCDEINRASPKTQSALLEAMAERSVTVMGETHRLPVPFFAIATQNPIEQAGTYPLPEAQLDRFLLYIKIGYPSAEEETNILSNTTSNRKTVINPVLDGNEIQQLQQLVRDVSISNEMVQFVADIIRATRPTETINDYVKEWVRWGAGPRAGQALILTAKARALFNDRYSVTMDDIKAMAYPVLRHRILMNFKADAEQITSDLVTEHLLKTIPRVKSLLG